MILLWMYPESMVGTIAIPVIIPIPERAKKTCAFEICEQLNWKTPDWVLVSVGDGNIISGLWKGFREFYQLGLIEKLPKMVAVQSDLSNAISKITSKIQKNFPYPKLGGYKIDIQPVKAKTIADSISVDLPRDGLAAVKAIIDSDGMAVEVADEEILRAMKEMARKWGIFGEPAAAASFAGLKKLLSMQAIISIDDIVVCVITGSGLKDVESVMKISEKPQIIEPSLEAVQKIFGPPNGSQ